MKTIVSYILVMLAAAMLLLAACKGNTGQTGGAKADSGAINVGSSGATDSASTTGSKGSPEQGGTGGTDTSSIGKGATAPTTDTTKSNP